MPSSPGRPMSQKRLNAKTACSAFEMSGGDVLEKTKSYSFSTFYKERYIGVGGSDKTFLTTEDLVAGGSPVKIISKVECERNP